MLKLFYILLFILSANCFAQSKTLFNAIPVKEVGFTTKETLGSWATDRGTFEHNLYIGGNSINNFTTSTVLIPVEEGGCNRGRSIMFNPQQDKNLKSINIALVSSQCKDSQKLKETKTLNPEICMQLANCYKGSTTFGLGSLTTTNNAREKSAAETISLMSSTTIDHLYDLEELKAYALEKYKEDFLPKECRDEDPTVVPPQEAGICMTKIIDNGFEMAQKNCRSVEVGCNPDYIDFAKDRKTENGKTSLMSEFIKTKTKTSAIEFMNNDSGITQDIASIITKESETPETRARQVMLYLSANSTKLDPVYKNYVKQSVNSRAMGEKDEIEAGLVKYIIAKKGKNTLDIMVELEVLRKKEAYRRLSENCSKVITVQKLCSIVNDVLNGAEVQVPLANFEKLMSRQEFSDPTKPLSRQEMADNIARCNTFTIESSIGKYNANGIVKLSNGLDLFSTGLEGSYKFKNIGIGGVSILGLPMDLRPKITVDASGDVTKKVRRDSAVIQKISSGKEDKTKDSVFTSSFTKGLVMDDAKRAEPKIVAQAVKVEKTENYEGRIINSKDDTAKIIAKEQESARIMQQQSTMLSPKVTPSIRQPEMISESQNDSVTKNDSIKKQPSADYNSLLGKISALEEKLAVSQKRAPVESSASKTVEPEESDLARELKVTKAALAEFKANEDLKAKSPVSNKKNIVASIDSKEEVEDDDDFEVASSGPVKEGRSVSTAAAVAASSSTSNSSGVERSAASIDDSKSGYRGASGSSIGSSGESQSSGGDGVVLTRLDGISGSKVSETISNMILAESGRPFYIEEGGMIKQIIPEVVDGVILKAEDGSPLYKTIVKGKVGEFKIAGKDKKKKEVIAKAASPADVKIQDYQNISTPAVRYREMQELIRTKN